MLQSIRVKNLGCFDDRDAQVNLAPLTILVGPNNAGKSIIIAGFNLLRTISFWNRPEWITESYNLGEFQTAVHKHETSRTMEVGAAVGDFTMLCRLESGV